MIGPTQIDRWGQTNLSSVGDYAKPKTAILGVRGLPGNSINHPNSLFVPNHGPRVFVGGEVDMVSGVGYKKERWPAGAKSDFVDLRLIVTDLCVMDFGGPDHQIRVISLHPGVTFEEVQPVLHAMTENVLLEIQKTFDFFKATASSDRIDRIVVSGGASRVDGFTASLQERFNTAVEVFDPFKTIAFDPVKLGVSDPEGLSATAAVAVGLALRKTGDR